MKLAVVGIMMGCAVCLGAFAHKPSNTETGKSVHQTCTYNYITCKESCEYYQDASQIKWCEKYCDRRYQCRPKSHEVSSNMNEKHEENDEKGNDTEDADSIPKLPVVNQVVNKRLSK